MNDLKKNTAANEIQGNVTAVTEENAESLLLRSTDEVEYRIVDQSDEWLEASYQLLQSEFDSSVLDPHERYVEWLESNLQGQNPFPFLMMAAYLRDGDNAIIVGVVSGNIMLVEEYAGKNPDSSAPLFMFAIGHQITSKLLRGRGLPGIGTNLWKASIQQAKNWIEKLEGFFGYSMLEAETESLGFWTKMGYRWTQDVSYWQPPLEFYDNGDYINAEVPEILMLRPLNGMDEESISKILLKNIIATVYLNWSLHKYRTLLEPKAMKRAEDYVMKDLFGRVCQQMPQTDSIPLVPFENLSSRKNHL